MGMEIQVDSLEDMCALMCDNVIPEGRGRMTREEAIIHLENMHMKYDEFYHNLNCADQLLIERGNEALDMAIQALKSLDRIRAEIEQNAYPIVHGVNNHEKGMTLYGILQIIDKCKVESEE